MTVVVVIMMIIIDKQANAYRIGNNNNKIAKTNQTNPTIKPTTHPPTQPTNQPTNQPTYQKYCYAFEK